MLIDNVVNVIASFFTVPTTDHGSGVSEYREAVVLYESRPSKDGTSFEEFIRTPYAWRNSYAGRTLRHSFVRRFTMICVVMALAFIAARVYRSTSYAAMSNYGRYFPFVTTGIIVIAVAWVGLTTLQNNETRDLWINKILIERAGIDFRNADPPESAQRSSDQSASTSASTPSGEIDTKNVSHEVTPSLHLDHLWSANRQQIETYHKIVLSYASSSRAYTLAALGIGFLVITIMGGIAIHASGTATAVPASIVTAVSAALTGYVARATLRNSEASSQELRAFFEHPLDLERALAAERLVNAMGPTDQAKARLIVINYLTRDRSKPSASKPPRASRRRSTKSNDRSATGKELQDTSDQHDSSDD